MVSAPSSILLSSAVCKARAQPCSTAKQTQAQRTFRTIHDLFKHVPIVVRFRVGVAVQRDPRHQPTAAGRRLSVLQMRVQGFHNLQRVVSRFKARSLRCGVRAEGVSLAIGVGLRRLVGFLLRCEAGHLS